MTSSALRVLSLALVCSIFGTASVRTADHDSNNTLQRITQHTVQPNPMIYDEINNIDKMVNVRTNIDNHSYNKYKDHKYRENYNIDKYNEVFTKYNNQEDIKLNRHRIGKNNVKEFRQYYNGIRIEKNEYSYNRIKKSIYENTILRNRFEGNKIGNTQIGNKLYDNEIEDTDTQSRVKRQVLSSIQKIKCEKFKLDDKEMKITHPYNSSDKDKLYHSDVNCVLVLKAGEGQVIKLTFVDIFHIEEAEGCTYDYLEIRDGSQGYADLLKKVCGETFPPQITSSGPYIWMKFHADETIEYEGFHIDVSFENDPTSRSIPDSCNITLKESRVGTIGSSDEYLKPECKAASINQALDVIWTIRTPENTKIYLNFTHYSLATPNDCHENLVQVYGAKLEYDAHLAHYCGSIANAITTKVEEKDGDKGNLMYVRFFVQKTAKEKSSFEATYVAFRTIDATKEDDECDPDDEFDCDDNTCIATGLTCDGYGHCRLKADEDFELCKGETESMISQPHILVILVIFSLILSGMSFVFLFKCIKKLYQDHKIIKEHIAKSCEDGLDQMLEDSRFTLDAKKLQRDSSLSRGSPRASLERENHTNEMFKQQRKLSQQRKPSSIDSDFIPETHLDLDEEIWRKDVDSVPVPAQDIKIERNGRTRRTDSSKREESLRKKDSEEKKEKKEIRDASVGAPDTKESGCQTRESLFQAETAPSSEGSNSNSRGFSTFGYSGATIARPSPPAAPAATSQITIELLRQVPPHQESKSQKKIPDRRPMSTETTRSAPDVIIVSKPIR